MEGVCRIRTADPLAGYLLARVELSQSRPSYRPLPDVAQVAWMYQLRFLNCCKPSFCVISVRRGKREREKLTVSSVHRDASIDTVDHWSPMTHRLTSSVHGVRQILFVRKHQQHRVFQLILAQHSVQLVLCLVDTITIVRVDHEDQALRVLEVVSPERPNLVLSSDVLVFDRENKRLAVCVWKERAAICDGE